MFSGFRFPEISEKLFLRKYNKCFNTRAGKFNFPKYKKT